MIDGEYAGMSVYEWERTNDCVRTGADMATEGDKLTVDIKVVNPNADTERTEVIRVEPRSTMVNVYKYMYGCERVDTTGEWAL